LFVQVLVEELGSVILLYALFRVFRVLCRVL
jgi:hypothetical protein